MFSRMQNLFTIYEATYKYNLLVELSEAEYEFVIVCKKIGHKLHIDLSEAECGFACGFFRCCNYICQKMYLDFSLDAIRYDRTSMISFQNSPKFLSGAWMDLAEAVFYFLEAKCAFVRSCI